MIRNGTDWDYCFRFTDWLGDLDDDHRVMKPFQKQVVKEHEELCNRLTDLRVFVEGQVFKGLAPSEQARLEAQQEAMGVYARILRERIKFFGE